DRIGDGSRVDLLRAADQVVPGRGPMFQEESPVRLAALRFQLALLLLRQLQRRAVIDRREATRHLPLAPALQFLRCLVAGIKPPRLLQLLGRLLIKSEARRLPELLVPGEAEPGQVVPDPGDVLLLGALKVRVVEAQDKDALLAAGEKPIEDGWPDIADVEPARGARRKANLYRHSALQSRNVIPESTSVLIRDLPVDKRLLRLRIRRRRLSAMT